MLQKDEYHVDKLKVFNCLNTNAGSLLNKLDELKARIQYCEGSMILQELLKLILKIADTTLERQNYKQTDMTYLWMKTMR